MILILGGTTEGNAVGDLLKRLQFPFVLTVTSDYGAQMAARHQEEVQLCQFTKESLKTFIDTADIRAVVDATHPHAAEISSLAQAVAQALKISYIRYERPQSPQPELADLHYVHTPEAAAELAGKLGQRIFITGSKHIGTYVAHIDPSRLFVRVLPAPEVLREVLDLGIPADHIIAMKGPFTEALNQALFEAFQIEVLVTKESGQTGGFLQKIASAKASGVQSVVIQRPVVNYLESVESLGALEEWLLKYYKGGTDEI